MKRKQIKSNWTYGHRNTGEKEEYKLQEKVMVTLEYKKESGPKTKERPKRNCGLPNENLS